KYGESEGYREAHGTEIPGSLTVLLVDDCEDALKALSAVLELEGHSVSTANSGAAAIRELEALTPDVAIVDIVLADMDGFDVARAIRCRESCRGTSLLRSAAMSMDQRASEFLRQASTLT